MGDIAQRGNRLTKKINYDKAYLKSRSLVRDVYEAVAPKHSPGQKKKPHSSKEGRAASFGRTVRDVGKILSPERVKKFGGGRTNLLEQLGRVEAEPSNRNRRAEISRVHGELNRGYKTGGRVKKAVGGWMLRKPVQKLLEGIGGGSEGKPHSTRAGRISAGVRKIKRGVKEAKKFGSEQAETWDKRKEGVGAAKRKPHKSFQKKKK